MPALFDPAKGQGEHEYYHGILAATLVAPGHDKVVPLKPEFIVPQDGSVKQDCENMAARRRRMSAGTSSSHASRRRIR